MFCGDTSTNFVLKRIIFNDTETYITTIAYETVLSSEKIKRKSFPKIKQESGISNGITSLNTAYYSVNYSYNAD